MPAIRFHDVHFGYDGREPLLDQVVLHLSVGFTGIVGPNGAGKTTLLRLAVGELAASGGTLAFDPPGASVRLCEQRVDEPGPDILALCAAIDRHSMRWMRRFSLDPYQVERWRTLSAGERKRWQLAAALSVEPDVLALDEPTNHLDGATRELVIDALARFHGIGLIVSHDRALLDTLTTKTIHVDRRRALPYEGNYSVARETWEADAEARRDAWESADRERKRAARLLADARRVESSASKAVSASSRIKGPKDSDARSIGEKNLAAWAAAKAGNVVARRRQALDKAEALHADITMEKARGRTVFLDWEPPPRKWLVTLDGVALRAGPRLIARDVQLAVARDARIHVAGNNGAGKSTLLTTLVAAATIPSDKLLYLPQEIAAEEGAALAHQIACMPRDIQGRVGQFVAALGLDPSRALRSSSPSPGEVRKLALALGLARRVWLVVLDEPTNHLDLPSIERVESALGDYPGALVLASHDVAFARGLTEERWELAGGEVVCAP